MTQNGLDDGLYHDKQPFDKASFWFVLVDDIGWDQTIALYNQWDRTRLRNGQETTSI